MSEEFVAENSFRLSIRLKKVGKKEYVGTPPAPRRGFAPTTPFYAICLFICLENVTIQPSSGRIGY